MMSARIADRRMVPRWRSLRQTAKAGELRSVQGLRVVPPGSPDLDAKMTAWQRKPSLVTAAELVEEAIVEGREKAALYAARRIFFMEHDATPLLKQQAALLMVRAGAGSELPDGVVSPPDAACGLWKKRVRLNSRDALAWVELALCQTIAGHIEHAHRSIQVALALEPNSRHVLRSAARFFLHYRDPEHAHAILLRSDAAKFDPWLIATEVTLAELAQRHSSFVRHGASLLDTGGVPPRHLTELAGSIGTAELVTGNRKRARKYFNQSLLDPNANSLAQAEWASPAFGDALIPPSRQFQVDDAFEAASFRSYHAGDHGKAIENCKSWADDEPYSIRPFEFSSALASAEGLYDVALELSLRGLKIRPRVATLSNAAVFSLACKGELDRAEEYLRKIDARTDTPTTTVVAKANRGLIAFRRGNPDLGRGFYREVIAEFSKLGDTVNANAALYYLARESQLAQTEDANKILAEAASTWRKAANPRIPTVLLKLLPSLKQDPIYIRGLYTARKLEPVKGSLKPLA
jgi:tetratricopeptide (TPR) repeat protein